jgi:hypothetical protein
LATDFASSINDLKISGKKVSCSRKMELQVLYLAYAKCQFAGAARFPHLQERAYKKFTAIDLR